MMNSLSSGKTTLVISLGPKAESRLYKIAHTARSNRMELGLVHYIDVKDEFLVP